MLPAHEPSPLALAVPNARWSVDFVHDHFADGRQLHILNVLEDVTKECLAAVVDTSISGRRVARRLTALVANGGKPSLIVGDYGTAFTSSAMLAWPANARVPSNFIAPGKPRQIVICELFHSLMREEPLKKTLLFGHDYARCTTARRVADYNHTRPHSTLGYLGPVGFAAQSPQWAGGSTTLTRVTPLALCPTRAHTPISTQDSDLA